VNDDDPENAAFSRANKAGLVPDTDLARVIYRNMMMFPDEVLLTRVGGFYEVSSASYNNEIDLTPLHSRLTSALHLL
jgi:hypothetical protein